MKNNTNVLLLWSLFTVILIAVFSVLNLRCSSAEYIPEKLESSLHQQIRNYESDHSPTAIHFIGKINSDINENMKSQLEVTGITVESVIGDIFTASGSAESIKKTTLIDFVVFLELAKKMDMK